MTALELGEKLALLLALALFLGLAFEEVYKRDQRNNPGGIRTFPLLALSGAMLYLIEPDQALAFVAGLLALGAWLYRFIGGKTTAQGDRTLMIPASNLLAYVLGPIALTQPPWLVLSISVAAVLLLGSRESMHALVQRIPQEEILTTGKFLVLAGVILPLVPNQPITALIPRLAEIPFFAGIGLTPYHIWLAVVAISGLSYLGYLAQRYGSRQGSSTLLSAAIGGIYSSTATTVVLAKRLRENGGFQPELSAGIVLATGLMYLRLETMVALFDPALAGLLGPAVGGLFLTAMLLAFRETRAAAAKNGEAVEIPAANPLQLGTAIIFAGIFLAVSVVTNWAGAHFGQGGVFALAVIVGASDIDPFILSLLQGGVPGLTPGALAASILIAASSNNLVKAGYALTFGGRENAKRPALILALLAVSGYGAAAIYAF